MTTEREALRDWHRLYLPLNRLAAAATDDAPDAGPPQSGFTPVLVVQASLLMAGQLWEGAPGQWQGTQRGVDVPTQQVAGNRGE